VIPGEDAAELEALAANYSEEFDPTSSADVFVVDEMVAANWQLRRLRKIAAQLWQRELTGHPQGPDAASDLAEAYCRNPVLVQVRRRIEATERAYFRALKEMRRIQKEEEAAEAEDSRKWREYLRSLPDEDVLPLASQAGRGPSPEPEKPQTCSEPVADAPQNGLPPGPDKPQVEAGSAEAAPKLASFFTKPSAIGRGALWAPSAQKEGVAQKEEVLAESER
jgi:hypothetical protein